MATQYNIEEVGRKARASAPNPQALQGLSDKQIGEAYLRKNPQGVTGLMTQKAPVVDSPKPKGLSDPELGMKVGKAVINAPIGFAKGIINAPRLAVEGGKNLGDFLYKTTFGKPVSETGAVARFNEAALKPTQAFQPSNTAQKVGYGAEKVAELFTPSGVESAAAGILPKVGNIARMGIGLGTKTLLQGGNVPEAGRATALGLAGGAVGEVLGAISKPIGRVLQTAAEKQYSKALAPTTLENKTITNKIVPELLKRGETALTRSSLYQKFSKGVEQAGEKMDEVLAKIPGDTPVSTAQVIEDLDKAKAAFMVKGIENGKVVDVPANAEGVAHIEGFQDILRKVGDTTEFENIRKLRQIWDKGVAQSKGFYGKTLTEGSKMEAQREAAGAIREQLAKQFPDLDKVNKEFHFWSNAQKVLGDTMKRTTGQNPLMPDIAEVAGAAAGIGKGGSILSPVLWAKALKGLTELTKSTGWRTISAVQKSRVADLIAANKLKQAVDLITRLKVAHSASGNSE